MIVFGPLSAYQVSQHPEVCAGDLELAPVDVEDGACGENF